jgi:abhydrolase domain-containing protein 17
MTNNRSTSDNNLKKILIGDFTLKRMIKSILFIYGSICLFLFFYADRTIFQPQPSSYPDSDLILKLRTADGDRISAIYLPNPTATYSILYAHGNAEDLGYILPALQELHDIGFAVFAYDYRGYGTSQGKPSERNAYQDIDAAYQYLTETLKVPPQRIIAYGRSVGGGSAIDLASRKPVGGLVVASSFTTAFRVVTRIPLFPFDKFTNLYKLDRVNCPVLILHGTKDEIIPFSHGQQLFAAVREPKKSLWVEGAGHNDLREVAGERYIVALQEFANLLTALQEK